MRHLQMPWSLYSNTEHIYTAGTTVILSYSIGTPRFYHSEHATFPTRCTTSTKDHTPSPGLQCCRHQSHKALSPSGIQSCLRKCMLAMYLSAAWTVAQEYLPSRERALAPSACATHGGRGWWGGRRGKALRGARRAPRPPPPPPPPRPRLRGPRPRLHRRPLRPSWAATRAPPLLGSGSRRPRRPRRRPPCRARGEARRRRTSHTSSAVLQVTWRWGPGGRKLRPHGPKHRPPDPKRRVA